jgi:hypothetical protein
MSDAMSPRKDKSMTAAMLDEIDAAIFEAAQSGSMLDVAHSAHAIAAANGGQAKAIAECLIAAGIKARIPMEIATPE